MTERIVLMGTSEIRDRLGMSRQRAYQFTQRPDWPEPYMELSTGKLWLRDDVEAWIRRHRPHLAGTRSQTVERPQ
jgi:prophage regulatory protein